MTLKSIIMDPFAIFIIALLLTAIVLFFLYLKKVFTTMVEKIIDLEKQLQDANNKIILKDIEIKSLIFQLDHPPKYKIGDKVGDLQIIGRKFLHSEFISKILSAAKTLFMMFLFGNSKSTKKSEVPTINYQWEYDVLNIKTGEKSKKKESELNKKA